MVIDTYAYIISIFKDGNKIPALSSFQKIMIAPEFIESFAFIHVETQDAKPKTVRANITIPENTLKHIELELKEQGMSRSAFLIHSAQASKK